MSNEQVLKLIQIEVEKAEKKFPESFSSIRAGHSIIEEEYEEFKNAVFADNFDSAFKEVSQLAAMCVRYMKNYAPPSVRLFH